MSEQENELKRALAENGSIDAEKAKQTLAGAVSRFNRRLKWTERRGMIATMILLAVFVFAGIKFQMASTTKAMIGYAIVMVLAYGLAITFRLVSTIMSMLLRVLKEIKQSQLESLGYPRESEISASDGTQLLLGRSRAITRWETTGWILAILLVSLAIAFATNRLSVQAWQLDMASFEGAPVTVEAPRIGAPVYYTVYIRMEKGVCKVSRVTPEHKQSELFWMGKGFVSNGTLPPGDSLRLDPQGNKGEYSVRFE